MHTLYRVRCLWVYFFSFQTLWWCERKNPKRDVSVYGVQHVYVEFQGFGLKPWRGSKISNWKNEGHHKITQIDWSIYCKYTVYQQQVCKHIWSIRIRHCALENYESPYGAFQPQHHSKERLIWSGSDVFKHDSNMTVMWIIRSRSI